MKPTRALGDEREHAVEHPDARAQDRADGDLLAGDPLRRHALERRLDLDLLGGEVLRRLVGEEERQLVDQLAEVLRSASSCRAGTTSLCWTSGCVDLTVTRAVATARHRRVRGVAAEARVERTPLAERLGCVRASAPMSAPSASALDDDPRRPRGSRPRRSRASSPPACRVRTPEATVGGRSSKGTVFRLTVMLHLGEPLLGVLARPLGRAQVELDEVRVGAAGEHVEPALLQPVRERVGVRAHLPLVVAEGLGHRDLRSRSPWPRSCA